MARHKKVQDKERVHPVMKHYQMSCCDCGLVHTIDFLAVEVTKRNKDGSWEYREMNPKKFRVAFQASRDNRATAQVRRWKKKQA